VRFVGIHPLAFIASVIGSLLFTGSVTAASVTLHPVADTSLIEFLPGNNLGGGPELIAGTGENLARHRPLIRFDVAGNLPAGARVTSAQFIVDVTKVPQNGFAFADYGLHRMLKPWGEGNQVSPTNCTSCAGWGAPATHNEASWLDAFAYAPGDWTAPGAQPTNDFVAAPATAATIYKEADNPYVFGSTPALVSDVQLWLDRPGTNFGWMLLCQAEEVAFSARRFGAREHPVSPPRLQISFLAPPAFDRVEKLPGQLNLYFTQLPDQGYRVESRTALGVGGWQTFANFPANGNTNSIVVADANPAAQRFFRLVSY
jgi:hypothetical protein